MTEKEQLEKENEQFSSTVLFAATAIYIAVCAMVLGGLAAMQPTFGDAFLLFFKDYGAIIAGLPVLIAVLVAKQQMDANRRQHVATIKRSFQKELDALSLVKEYLDYFDGKSWDDIISEVNPHDNMLNFPRINEATILTIEAAISANFSGHVRAVNFKSFRLEDKYIDRLPPEKLREEYKFLIVYINGLRKNHDETYKKYSQYWS